jgi:hypothetical protein
MTPEFNRSLPASLAFEDGSPVNFGLKGLQICGNSILPRLLQLGQPIVPFFPTNAEQFRQEKSYSASDVLSPASAPPLYKTIYRVLQKQPSVAHPLVSRNSDQVWMSLFEQSTMTSTVIEGVGLQFRSWTKSPTYRAIRFQSYFRTIGSEAWAMPVPASLVSLHSGFAARN